MESEQNKKEGGVGATIGSIIVILVIIIGGFYYAQSVKQKVSEKNTNSTELRLDTLSNSNDVADLEKDLNETNLENIDKEFSEIDNLLKEVDGI